jgi:hypothetical protein
LKDEVWHTDASNHSKEELNVRAWRVILPKYFAISVSLRLKDDALHFNGSIMKKRWKIIE